MPCQGADRSLCVRLSSPPALLIALFNLSLSSFIPRVSATSAWHTSQRCQGKNRMGRCWRHHAIGCKVAAEWWPVYVVCVCVFTWDSVGVVEVVLVKELLWPHFCFITPNLPLNIHTSVCEVSYGVIVRCQWAFTHTTLTWNRSMEHSNPLMVSNGEWHQSCHVSCYFSLLLFHFGLGLSVTP